MSSPSLLVVIPVRGDDGRLDRAITSAHDRAAGVVVVDDGSNPPIAGRDVQTVRTVGEGVAAARNRGVAAGTGDALVFLDADDELLEGWAAHLAAPFADDRVAAVCGAAEVRTADGAVTVRRPESLGPAFHDARGLFLAGAFAVRRSVFEAIGGYDEALAFSENTELALRLAAWCAASGHRIEPIMETVVRVHQSDQRQRRARYAHARLAAVEHLFEKHGEAISRDDRLRADYARVAGAAAAHLGRYADARRWFRRCGRTRADLARIAVTFVPVLRKRAWGTVTS